MLHLDLSDYLLLFIYYLFVAGFVSSFRLQFVVAEKEHLNVIYYNPVIPW